MHHKRKGPKSTRCGCLMCKPHKRQGTSLKQRAPFGSVRRMMSIRGDLRDDGLALFDKSVR